MISVGTSVSTDRMMVIIDLKQSSRLPSPDGATLNVERASGARINGTRKNGRLRRESRSTGA